MHILRTCLHFPFQSDTFDIKRLRKFNDRDVDQLRQNCNEIHQQLLDVEICFFFCTEKDNCALSLSQLSQSFVIDSFS